MHERKILYYPSIVIPRRWLYHTILYWDKISSVSPKIWDDIMEDRAFLELERDKDYQNMKFLKEEGYYNPIYPQSIYNKIESKLKCELELILRSEQIQKKLNYNWNRSFPYNWQNEMVYSISGAFKYDCGLDEIFIHHLPNKFERSLASGLAKQKNGMRSIGIIQRGRIEDSIIHLLEKLGLACKTRLHSNFYFVEGNAALIYSALLAKHLANEDSDYTVVSTDWREYESILFDANDKINGFPSLSAKFLDILPVPRDNTEIDSILKFKKNRESELLAFRELFNEMEKDISNAEDRNAIKRILSINKEKMRKGVMDIRKLMKESNLEIAMASFKSLIDIKQPALWATLATSYFASASTVPLTGALAIIQIGCSWIDKRNELSAKLKGSPYSYLYYAEEEKLIE